MRAVVHHENSRWVAIVYGDDNSVIYRSSPENRAGCAARVAFNYMEQWYGRPSTDTFVIDLDDW